MTWLVGYDFLALFLSLSLLSPLSLGQDSLELVSGDVMLGAMFAVNNVRGDDACGDFDIDTLKEVTAAQWFLDTLNRRGYIPGVKIGLEVYNTCQNGERATRSAVQMLEKFHVLQDGAQDVNTTKPLLGVLGPGRTQEAIMVARFLSSLPSSQRPLLISSSATGAALADRALYPNFFRVIPPDSTQVQVLLKLLQFLGWNYISIVFDDDAYGREAAQQLRSQMDTLDLCVPSFAALPLDYRSETFITTTNLIIDRLGGGDSSIITGVVFIGSVSTATSFVSRLSQRVNFVRFIFSEALSLQTSVLAGTTVGRGALVAVPPYLPLPEFRAFWNSVWTNRTVFSTEMQNNSWLEGYYTAETSCTLSNTQCWTQTQASLPLIQDDTQWLFEYYQVKAVAVFAAILKKLHSEACGQGYVGVCLQLKQLIRNDRGRIQDQVEGTTFNLQAEFSHVLSVFSGQTNVGFNDQGEITSGEHNGSIYDVFNYRECGNSDFCFQKVATYKVGGKLTVDTNTLRGYTDQGVALTWPNIAKSQCKAGYNCLSCIPSDLADQTLFVPGDVYIVVVAPVSLRAANNPLGCGDIRTSGGADMVQSVLFAVEQVNKKLAPFQGIFGNSKLGALIINSCYRELVIKEKLISLHKGTLILPDGRNSSHILPHIAGYVGAFFSTVSIAMYEVLSSLDTRFVILSPTNTSPELSDRSKYPLYLRLPSGEDTQVRAVLTLVRDLGHQYVQVLYDPEDVYSQVIKQRINSLSSDKAFNVCVVNNIASDSEERSFYSVLDDLRKNTWAPLVLMTVQDQHIKAILTDILPQLSASEKFRFLGTDTWARSEDLLTLPSASRLQGSLTLSVELPVNQLFSEYLRTTDPLTSINPWLKYFWEARKQCYFDGSFRRKNKPSMCPADLTSDYVQSTWVPFYIDAVYAFALGLNTAMQQQCRQSALCPELTSEELVAAIRNVRLDLFNSGVPVNVFDDNSDGDVGYKIFQVSPDVSTPDPSDMTYVRVGRYEHSSLTLERESLWILKNLGKIPCPNPSACQACFPLATPSPNTGTKDDSLQGPLIGTIVVMVILIIAVVVLVVVLVVACRRLKAQRERLANEAEKFAFDNVSASRSADSRPLPPILESGMDSGGSGSGSGGGPANTYDYLYPEGGSHSRGHYAYERHGPPSDFAPSAGSAPAPSTRPPLPRGVSVNSSGYVTRSNNDGRLNRDAASDPAYYDRMVSPLPNYDVAGPVAAGRQNSHIEVARPMEGGRQNSRVEVARPMEGGRQNSRVEVARPMEGGRQNSRVEEARPMEGGRQNSRVEVARPMEGGRQNSSLEDPHGIDGSAAPPVVFENESMPGEGSSPPPEYCGSSADSDYLTPMDNDYLTPHASTNVSQSQS